MLLHQIVAATMYINCSESSVGIYSHERFWWKESLFRFLLSSRSKNFLPVQLGLKVLVRIGGISKGVWVWRARPASDPKTLGLSVTKLMETLRSNFGHLTVFPFISPGWGIWESKDCGLFACLESKTVVVWIIAQKLGLSHTSLLSAGKQTQRHLT